MGDDLNMLGLGKRATAEGWLPDLSDPATLGCLTALVREAWGDAAALIAALEAAP